MANITTRFVVPFSVAALIAAPATVAQEMVLPWQNHSAVKLTEAQWGGFNSSTAITTATQTWSELSAAIHATVTDSTEEGQSVSFAARQLALQVAASLEIVGNLSPTITDNEEGGIVFYWKGMAREIQIEIDRDGSHFTRIRGADGQISFENEGRGPVDTDRVNRMILDWSQSRALPHSGGPKAA